MQATRSTNSAAEKALRSELHRRGLRFRIHRPLLPNKRLKADIVFAGRHVVVFVDGCFWHGCHEHGSQPRTNSGWWAEKIAANRARDVQTDADLRAHGWTVIRVWEHDDPIAAADRIQQLLLGASA